MANDTSGTDDTSGQADTDEILSERLGPVEVLTLNRPEALNAFTPAMIDALDTALRGAGSDRTCRAVVLTGAGERAFCAGVDVRAVAARDAASADHGASGSGLDPITAGFENLHLNLSQVIRTIHSSPIPIIAAVNGHAVGGGFAFAAAADLRIGSTGARFADGFVKRGISGCEMGLSYFLPKIVGAARAFEWMLTGRTIEADEALEAGLVSRVVDAEGLVEAAVQLGQEIAALAPMAVSTTKEVMWANLQAASLDHALSLESRNQIMVRNTADAAEARASFLERRNPEFSPADRPRPLR
ncbi:MAG: enoyl-CoA hydratase/isomerase family protein [Actinomycetia bacterium]|nr:enoyl-CoA hydratase/isomerase family protein [Actinomycetes bacterium]MCP5034781.1 enoyl-CoA hydratase/isomerase family protein [Actinomycetes bacterium]